MSSSGDDCYFFYYSSCSKGALCPFRHEPAALENETVCSFWEKGMCSKPKCMFRHMKVEKKRNVIQCYWESQPGGCKKPHCSFLHDKPKDPYPEAVNALLQTTTTSKIIINKNKIAELGHLILPLTVKDGDIAGSTPDETAEPSKPVRLPAKLRIGSKPLVESEATRGVKQRLGGIKSRLGPKLSQLNPKLSNRVASVVLDNNEKLEVSECSDDEELNSEEEALRADAIKTIDLRKRLATKSQTSEDDNDLENVDDDDLQQVRSAVRVVPQVEKRKKEKKSKKKKKEKKNKRSKSPSEEPEDTKPKRKVLAKSRKYHEEMINNEDYDKPSLADRIAAQRDLEHRFGDDGNIRNRVGRAEYHESDKRRTERERRESETRKIGRRDRSRDEHKSRKMSLKGDLESGRKSESEKETLKSPEERRKRRKSVDRDEASGEEEKKASIVKRSKVTSDEKVEKDDIKNVDKVSVDEKVQDFNSVLDDVENLLNSTDDEGDDNEVNLDVSKNTNDFMDDLDDVINN